MASPPLPRGPAPTVADVAREAGVSTATVSRCINTPARVNAPTRERVQAVIDRLGYAPNFGARALVAKRTHTIGAIIPTMENAIFARGIQALQEELGRSGYTLLVASSSYRPELEEDQIRTLMMRGADGLLLIGFDRRPAITAWLEDRAVPYVVAWAYDAASDMPSIGFHNRQAMADLARTGIEMGHRRIAVVTAPMADNDRARTRVAGVFDAARAAGIDPNDIPILETPYSFENGAAAMAQLMARPDPTTLVICGNDVLAVGAMSEARKLGLTVPDDVSVTGFDDIEVARVVSPALTTVHVPHREMGRVCAQTLVALLDGTIRPQSRDLGTEIRLRASLAPPPDEKPTGS